MRLAHLHPCDGSAGATATSPHFAVSPGPPAVWTVGRDWAKTAVLAFANRGSLDDRLEPDFAAADRAIAVS
jgi:hypothetical protein